MNHWFPSLKARMRALGGLLFVLSCLTSGAQAQVSVDMRALDQMGPAQPPARVTPVPARPTPAPAAASHPVARPGTASGVAARAGAPTAKATAAGAHAAQKPSPVAPTPPPAVISNVPPVPIEQPATPPPSTVVPAPAPSPRPLPPPVRLVFDTGQTDLTPANEAAIRDLAQEIPAPDTSSVNVVAYAAGKPDDASTARRLSLSRGMAVRSVLLASGVPSAQIYVRALGSAATDGPADRVELVVTRIGTVSR